MSHNRSWVALLTALLALILMVTPALATTPPVPAANIKDAGAPLTGWVELAPGAIQWYKFDYDFDNSKKDTDPAEVLIDLKANMPGAFKFEVWTPGRLAAPLPDPEEDNEEMTVRTPVGVGSPIFLKETYHLEGPYPQHKHFVDVMDRAHLCWVGGGEASETYYVMVKNTSNTPATYRLTITGPTISF